MVSNIVLMGMGEPLHNVDNVIKALNIITDCDGLAVSKRRVTLSTSGIAPNIPRVAKETGVKLAISLHAPNNEKRSQIMPINNRYPLEKVLTACQERENSVLTVVDELVCLDDCNSIVICQLNLSLVAVICYKVIDVHDILVS